MVDIWLIYGWWLIYCEDYIARLKSLGMSRFAHVIHVGFTAACWPSQHGCRLCQSPMSLKQPGQPTQFIWQCLGWSSGQCYLRWQQETPTSTLHMCTTVNLWYIYIYTIAVNIAPSHQYFAVAHIISQIIHVWYIYLHLPHKWPKCR